VAEDAYPSLNEVGQFFIHHHQSLPGPPLEKIQDLNKAIDDSKDGFLYLKSSPKVKKLVGRTVTKHPSDTNAHALEDDQPLVDYLEKLVKAQYKDHTTTLSEIQYFTYPSGDGWNPTAHIHKDRLSQYSFIDSFSINIWIAKKDVKGWPLIIVRPGSKRKYSTNPKLMNNPGLEYVMVKDMKARQMIVFKGTDVIHGSSLLVDQGCRGPRECVVVQFKCEKSEKEKG
jgi:hypothetical protein